MKLSVVIPIYNVADTIDRCLESIVSQDYQDMQIILVDDGSTDGSGTICDKWAGHHDYISVIHKRNGGLSDARNAGIEAASGDLITFVDSDDFIAPGTFSSVIKEMKSDADVIEYDAMLFHGSKKERRLSLNENVYTEMTNYWIECRGYAHAYAWNKIYRRWIFDKVRYPVGKVFEDVLTMPLILRSIHSIQTTSTGMYYYCCNEKGITATAGIKEKRTLLKAHLDNWDVTTDDTYLMHVVNLQLDVCMLDRSKPLLQECSVKSLKGLTRNNKIKALLMNVVGIGGLCRIYGLFGHIFHK